MKLSPIQISKVTSLDLVVRGDTPFSPTLNCVVGVKCSPKSVIFNVVLPGISAGTSDKIFGGLVELVHPEHPAIIVPAKNAKARKKFNTRWERVPITVRSCVCADMSI